MNDPISQLRRPQRIRHEVKRRELVVSRVIEMGASFRSITFTGESLADFVSESFDDHVKLILDAESPEPVKRDYTPRSFDQEARELTIEFSIHGDGPAARWARIARPGATATIAGPRSSMVIPHDYDWHLLIGDETGLPAIARRLEELPKGARVTVIGQVEDSKDQRDFDANPSVQVSWVASDAELIASVQAMTLPPGDGYVWCAGESATMLALRRILVEEKGHDPKAIRAAAYWNRGSAAHHENIEPAAS